MLEKDESEARISGWISDDLEMEAQIRGGGRAT